MLLVRSHRKRKSHAKVLHRQVNANRSVARTCYEVVSDFNTWTKWSPWLCVEPDATVEVSEDSNSEGSMYSWNGQVVGEGEMEHRRLVPNSRIEEELRFLKPWKSQAEVAFDVKQEGEGSSITWTMDGSLPWFMFWMKNMMVNFIGMDYERGLKMLKEHIETGEVLSQTEVNGVVDIGPLQMVGVRKNCNMADINKAMEDALCETMEKIQAAGVQGAGVMAAYHRVDLKAKTFDFTAGAMLAADREVPGLDRWALPSSRAFNVKHTGSYDNLGNSWYAAYKHVEHNKLKQNQKVATFEIYRNDPNETAPRDLVTDIYLPLK